jgi:lipopolysaccharide/colanic/teichoic acid biosynthesis glycosyltransferase
MVVIAIAIKLDTRGPIFFSQDRVGENGRLFRVYKFRSMVDNAELRRHEVVDLDALSEPAFSLDELPQFVNVLRGEMSLVGPRPEEAALVARYNDWQRRRLSVKPGMTGPMQINGRGDLTLAQRVALEVEYIEHYSLWRDVAILLKTLPAVLRGEGSY